MDEGGGGWGGMGVGIILHFFGVGIAYSRDNLKSILFLSSSNILFSIFNIAG